MSVDFTVFSEMECAVACLVPVGWLAEVLASFGGGSAPVVGIFESLDGLLGQAAGGVDVRRLLSSKKLLVLLGLVFVGFGWLLWWALRPDPKLRREAEQRASEKARQRREARQLRKAVGGVIEGDAAEHSPIGDGHPGYLAADSGPEQPDLVVKADPDLVAQAEPILPPPRRLKPSELASQRRREAEKARERGRAASTQRELRRATEKSAQDADFAVGGEVVSEAERRLAAQLDRQRLVQEEIGRLGAISGRGVAEKASAKKSINWSLFSSKRKSQVDRNRKESGSPKPTVPRSEISAEGDVPFSQDAEVPRRLRY